MHLLSRAMLADTILSLVYAKMSLILSNILYNFDLELIKKEKDWIGDQKVFTLWEKPSLIVNLRPVMV